MGLNSPEGAPDNAFFNEFSYCNLNAEGGINKRCVKFMYLRKNNQTYPQKAQLGEAVNTECHEISTGNDFCLSRVSLSYSNDVSYIKQFSYCGQGMLTSAGYRRT